ncbi:MAG TPA: hypothetical protein VIJ20_02805 [Solirubrobacteraceae bacterium]
MDHDPDNDIFDDVHPDRRQFVKRVVGATAFAAPFVASFDLQSLSSSVAHAQTNMVST